MSYCEQVSYDMLLARIGGLFALFLGISLVTVLECLEFSLFAVFTWPLFLVGCGGMCVRDKPSSQGQVCVCVCVLACRFTDICMHKRQCV